MPLFTQITLYCVSIDFPHSTNTFQLQFLICFFFLSDSSNWNLTSIKEAILSVLFSAEYPVLKYKDWHIVNICEWMNECNYNNFERKVFIEYYKSLTGSICKNR